MAKSKVKVVWDYQGGRELMQSKEITDCLEEQAKAIADRTEGNWGVDTYKGKNRSNATIYAEDDKTYYKNLKTNALLKGMGK